jgi:signal transduction histidine kinase
MRRSTIEPGLISIFRWYVLIRFSLLGLVAWSTNRNPDPANPRFPGVEMFFFGILLILLLWPRMQRALGRAFLPVTLVLATIGPIAGSAAQIERRLDAGLDVNSALSEFWVPFFLLFVPLLLIAWQYRYRAVVVFVVGSTLLDLAATIPLVEKRTADVAALSGLIVARGLLFAFVGLVVAKLAMAQKQARHSLAIHSATLEQLATSRERNRLARELHDTLAHSLSGIAVQLEAVRTLWDGDRSEARAMLERALADARGGLGEARRAIQTLRASPLEDLGLAGALEQLGETMAERYGFQVATAIADNIGGLDPEIENAIYRIADEALTNVGRHAAASEVSVDLRRKSGKIRLAVADDGHGFDAVADTSDGHMGINGMRERAELAGGSLEISSDNGGTSVVFEVAPWK